ncbi:MAG: ROK family protein [Planctomycetes bacterium]|nr:ROK family protein [Planctomycetota bacterium]
MTARGDALGCDVGGTTIQLVHLRRGRISSRREIPSPRSASPAEFLDHLTAAVRDLAAGVPTGAPVGVALPGFLDERRRRIVHLSHLPRLDSFPLAARLERRLCRSVVLDADSNAGAVGESRLGAGRGARRVLYITLGTGLGAALCVDGEPVRVSRHTVGQVAHVPLRAAGPRCTCGRRGCAEALLCARGLALRAGIRPGPNAARRLCERADGGDPSAAALWAETGAILGDLLRILIPLVSSDVVVIGGGLAAAARHFLPEARRRLGAAGEGAAPAAPELRISELASYAGAAGAALLALDAKARESPGDS